MHDAFPSAALNTVNFPDAGSTALPAVNVGEKHQNPETPPKLSAIGDVF